MSQDTESTDPQRSLLYDIAHDAQIKAKRARQKKMKCRARTVSNKEATGTKNNTALDRPAKLSVRQQMGRRAEDQAAYYLESQGLIVLERNIHCRMGEIDLIATDRSALIFIEVRLRGSLRYGGAAASVDRHKQQRLIRAAQLFLPRLCLRYFGGKMPACRFDVVTINANRLQWIKHAFDHSTT